MMTPRGDKPGRENWQPDDSATRCSLCSAGFSIFRWKHHCRACGNIFCQNCCSKRIGYTPFSRKHEEGYVQKEKRVCEACCQRIGKSRREVPKIKTDIPRINLQGIRRDAAGDGPAQGIRSGAAAIAASPGQEGPRGRRGQPSRPQVVLLGTPSQSPRRPDPGNPQDAPDPGLPSPTSSDSQRDQACRLWAQQLSLRQFHSFEKAGPLSDRSARAEPATHCEPADCVEAVGLWRQESQVAKTGGPSESPRVAHAADLLDKQFKIANFVHGGLEQPSTGWEKDEQQALLTYYWYNLQAQRAALEARLVASSRKEAMRQFAIAKQKMKMHGRFLRDLDKGQANDARLSSVPCARDGDINGSNVTILALEVLNLSMQCQTKKRCESKTYILPQPVGKSRFLQTVRSID